MWEFIDSIKIITVMILLAILPILMEDQRIITSLKHSKSRVIPTIIHGNTADEGTFPYLVSIKQAVTENVWINYCGGSIIQPLKLLTAAHCFESNDFFYFYHPDNLRVVAGSISNSLIYTANATNTSEEQWRQIQHVILHQHFYFPMNDIALVFVELPFFYTAAVNYVVPARRIMDYAGPCYTAGFGQSEESAVTINLLWAEIDLLSRSQCNDVWEMNMDSFLCSQTVWADVSGGDSGGPLVCSDILDAAEEGSGSFSLVGIVTGKNYDKTTLYTRVSEYRQWIDSNGSCLLSYNFIIVLHSAIKCIWSTVMSTYYIY